ncbi:MAG: CHASE2 domain-containing protein [Gammaproteobacteria bacterium]|nr:CHASE2 domain-containing protein [Gammaproteobacteria bacterium]NNJ50846.1 CHASE2 domain-containing protein [Gammaproteobacteria bacterium]
MKLIETKGNTSSGVIEHFFLVALLAFVAGLFVHNNVLWRWDNLLYDAQLSFWTRTVPDDIIIVAIDDESLEDLGRWPWPRSQHASLINKLELESPKVIGLDIIFSESDFDNPLSDVLMARAMRASGKVVLPVFMTKQSSSSFPVEALPLPELSTHAAALGHVHIDVSDDGIARRVFLREGIGEPHWMHYSLAILDVAGATVSPKYDIEDDGLAKYYSPMQWSREQPFLIPYAGPPGHFKQIGYSQVLSGQYQKNLFRDKIVLIGTTAEGLGDALPTPFSGDGGIMPGIEIVANVIDAIRNDLNIRELDKPWLILITAMLVALPVLIYPYVNPGSTLLVLLGIILGSVALAALLLWLFGIWLPVSTVLLFQTISYPLWSWRRLVLAMRHINAELDNLSDMQKALTVHRERNIADEISFISLFIPIKGWVLQDEDGHNLMQHGSVPACNLDQLNAEGWSVDGYRYWAQTRYHNKPCRLGLSMGMDAVITDEEKRLLNSLIHTPLSVETEQGAYVKDVLQTKIQQAQAVGSEYEELRHIIDDSLSGMANGVLICSSRGQVLLSNRRAGWFLYGDDDADLNGESVINILQHITLKDGGSWQPQLQRVMFRQVRVLAEAQHEAGRDLMVEISPLQIISDVFDGFVVNFSDISRLKASERKRTEVLNFLSHDLRSPLSSMLAMIELAKNKSDVDEMRSMLTNMEQNTHKTLHLAEQFLQLARANTSENIEFYDIDFNSVVLNAIDQLWALSDKMQVSVTHRFDRDELWTHAEADLLERAIVNLLSNAIKHSSAGDTVNITVTLNDNEINCCVIDQGSGIPMEDLPHLFEMFRRSKGTGVERIQGIGLGLAFVDAVARRHSGHVDVESRPGEGSSFCLKIPKADPVDPIEQTG